MFEIFSIGGYVCLGLGILAILIAAVTYKRKGEAEISQSLIEVPVFKIGIIVCIIGLVLKIIFH